ncbi:uncharacterized protein BP5553_01910 [Venustampulla echinocandica]|uniref:DUF7603 domain-containing protein n=1 Tax=Venustampulla echinocandica TaxID=2656787 RepID=A0A370U2D5_9HELO|nr:uncharacterized protein BP5553_01910 [Venustampulla echinocandica]RDL41931.1 hypothetical protein BP5553_01910 [Venustampulla echinocandica]
MASPARPPFPQPSNPSVPQSDTQHASSSSDLVNSRDSLPANNSTLRYSQGQTNNRPRIHSLSLRSRAFSSASSTSSSSVRRKPLPSTASPLATRFSSGSHLAATIELPEPSLPRLYTSDSPTLHEFPPTSRLPFQPAREQSSTDRPSRTSNEQRVSISKSLSPEPSPTEVTKIHTPNPPDSYLAEDARLTLDSALTSASESIGTWYSASSTTSYPQSTMSIFSNKPTPPHNINQPHNISRTFSNESNESNTTISKSQPKSPGGSKLGSFFGWGGDKSPISPTASYSESSISPIPSPQITQSLTHADASRTNASRPVPTAIDVPKANADPGQYFGGSYLQIPLATPTTPIQVEEMERELKEISSELAASIRREMDLEDLVDRLQSEAQNTSSPGKRTSDYFSDSGTSSIRYGEPDAKQDELDRLIRKTEQEKAQMRVEVSEKVQEERSRRKVLESHIRTLEEKASQVDLVSINSLDTNGRLKDLESTCEDLRRRLSEERQVKDNFEDLLTALKGELESSHNERDNLRDEIVPQLRARVEGLEAQAAQHEQLTYEQTKMQQEFQALKSENSSLIQAQRMQTEMKKFDSIAEEGSFQRSRGASIGLSRSNSLAQAPASRSRPPSLTRSTSVKTTESREALAERVKDIELQRDALHRALKSLLERQEHQNRENQKKIRQLEMERDRALTDSPRRMGYDREVANLREEINTLRRRADEAIEQKWQCEKGLSGLKMDLDRAEQEIGSLRNLLQENDILIPAETRPRSGEAPESGHVSSESLERAYRDLQKAYAQSLDRVKNLELSGPKGQETSEAIKQLERSLANATSERDFAKREADSLRGQTDSLRAAEKAQVGEELALADELRNSAKRVEGLAAQVQQQLASNSTLRKRLAETIERGEKNQSTNAEKIMFMQSKLKSLEDQLMAAQQTSEARISKHEEEISNLRESHTVQLQRMKDGLRSPRLFGSKSPTSPMFANSPRTPNLLSTTSGKGMSVQEDSKMDFLKQRVMDLERALADADREMEEVVGRMNIAQIEVMDLQNQREEAVRETRKLQKKVEEEKLRAFEGRFASITS